MTRHSMLWIKTVNCKLADTRELDMRDLHCLLDSKLSSVLWHCWLGGRKGIRPVKKLGDSGGGHWLVWMEWRPAGWPVCLPLLIFPCTIKSRSPLLALAHPGGPRKSHKTAVVVVVSFCYW